MRRLRYSSRGRNSGWISTALILIGFLVSVLAGCKGDERDQIRLMIWNTKGNNQLYQQVVKKFEADHPGKKVRIEENPIMGYEEKLIILMGAKDPPDVAMLFEDRYSEYIRQNALSDLTEFVSSDRDIKKIIGDSELKRLYRGERIMAIPTGIDGIVYIIPKSSMQKKQAEQLISLLVRKTYKTLSGR